MRLKTGNKAISFSIETITGKTISLEEFNGKPLLLMFFRYGSCPMCNLRLRDFAQYYPSLHERGLEVAAFFHSSARSILANAGKQKYPFHLVPDGSRSKIQSVSQLWCGDFMAVVLSNHDVAKFLCRLGTCHAIWLLGWRGLADGQNACGLSDRARWRDREGSLWR